MHWYVSGERRIIAVDSDSADAQEGRPNRVDVFGARVSAPTELLVDETVRDIACERRRMTLVRWLYDELIKHSPS